jgi:hypothetical protein
MIENTPACRCVTQPKTHFKMLATGSQKNCQHFRGLQKGGDNVHRPAEINLPGGFGTMPALDWGLKLA